MLRRLFTLLSALSLLLCAATVVLWVRSWIVSDEVTARSWRQPPNPTWTRLRITSGRGVLSVRHDHFQYVYQGTDPRRGEYYVPKVGVVSPEEHWLSFFSAGSERVWHSSKSSRVWAHGFKKAESRLGFFWKTERQDETDVRPDFQIIRERWQGGIPYWLAAAAFALMPAVVVGPALRNRRRRRRTRAGLCPSCGYDLCATPGRCPECGTSPAEVKA